MSDGDKDEILLIKISRQEELNYRKKLYFRRNIQNLRRQVDEKSYMLKSLADACALIGGFSGSMLVECSFNNTANPIVMTIFCSFCSTAIGMMFLCMINCSYMLMGVLKFNTHDPYASFNDFWRKRCEYDWILSLRAFTIGISFSIISLALLTWVILEGYLLANIITSCLGVLAVIMVVLSYIKWRLVIEQKQKNDLQTQ